MINVFNKAGSFYKERVSYIDNEVYNKSEEYWEETVSKNLTKDELGVYKMLDTFKL
jgi:hypothetical protein